MFRFPQFSTSSSNNSGTYEHGIVFANVVVEDKVSNVHQGRFKEVRGMKRLLALILVWTLLVVTGTLVSADGKTGELISRQNVSNQRRLSDGIR